MERETGAVGSQHHGLSKDGILCFRAADSRLRPRHSLHAIIWLACLRTTHPGKPSLEYADPSRLSGERREQDHVADRVRQIDDRHLWWASSPLAGCACRVEGDAVS